LLSGFSDDYPNVSTDSEKSESYSPQLIHHTNQDEERVLADSLLEGVWAVAECGVCALWLKTIKPILNSEYKMHEHA